MAKQFTIIDGYNVLHECGFVTGRAAVGELEKARDRLLKVIVKFVSAEDRSRTTVVFDSQEPNLPNRFERDGILVEFASDYEDADQLIEQLIAKHSAAKQLTVVSSDHRLHKAARTRGAKPIDSGDWLDGIQQQRNANASRGSDGVGVSSKSGAEKSAGQADVDVDYWLNEMEVDAAEIERSIADKPRFRSKGKGKHSPRPSNESGDAGTNSEALEQSESSKDENKSNNGSNDGSNDDLLSGNPFPPGYADDLFE